MRLLVIEDEVRLAEAVARGLRSEGFEVDLAHSGPDGLWRAREGSYSAIVLDILLPGLNGYAVCRELRAGGDRTPVLMLTAKQGEHDEAEGLELGADDFLRKPFSFVVLVARLRALVRRGTRPRPTVLQAGELRVDPASRRVWLSGVEIDLTAREFAVLEYLAHHPGEVLAKKDILDHVWDFDFEGDPNIVEVYIRRLRTKLDRPLIETLRGAGYRLVSAGD